MPLQDLTPQLRTRLHRVEKIVGLFVAVATLLLLAGFVYYLYRTADRKGWFVEKAKYHTYVMSAEGLSVGDPIIMMGFSVGEITTIEAQPPDSYYAVFVGFEIRRPYYGYIWSDSKLKISAADLLGRRKIEIIKGYDGLPTVKEENNRVVKLLIKKQYVPVIEAPMGVFMNPSEDPALTERAEKLVAQVEAALPNILGLTNQLAATLNNVAGITSNANLLLVQAQPLVTNITAITANLANPAGSLGEWIIPTNINSQITATIGSANTTVTNVNRQITILSASLNETLLNLAAITSNLHIQVQQNDRILSEISDLVVETDDMMQGLKRHWILKSAFPADEPPPSQLPLQPRIVPLPGGGK